LKICLTAGDDQDLADNSNWYMWARVIQIRKCGVGYTHRIGY